jgi:hypothetical protein
VKSVRCVSWVAVAIGLVVMLPAVSIAGSVVVPNPSFESPDVVATTGGNTWGYDIDDWDTTEGGTLDPLDTVQFLEVTEAAFGVAVGAPPQHIGMDNGHYVVQDLGVGLEANTMYKMSALVGNRAGWADAGNMSKFSLWVGDAELGAKVVDAATEVAESDFADFSFMLTTGDTPPEGNIVLRLESVAEADGGNGRAHWDNIRLTVVPEPSTLVLLGLALVGLIGYRRARS